VLSWALSEVRVGEWIASGDKTGLHGNREGGRVAHNEISSGADDEEGGVPGVEG
jgi:hypothetical protein